MPAARFSAGPDIVRIAALLGDRARACALLELMSGRALTATELASVAGVAKATMSSHLAQLREARLIAVEAQGRHRYFRLASADVAHLIESVMGFASRSHASVRAGPSDPALRKARVCYDHLAGELGVYVHEQLMRRGALVLVAGELQVSVEGATLLRGLGVDADALKRARRVFCRTCLDWSERRSHLAGALGAALLERIVALRWAKLKAGTRVVTFSPDGERALKRALELEGEPVSRRTG